MTVLTSDIPERYCNIRCKDANAMEPCRAAVQALAFHPAGELLLTAGLDKTVRFFAVDGTKNQKVSDRQSQPLDGKQPMRPIRCKNRALIESMRHWLDTRPIHLLSLPRCSSRCSSVIRFF